MFVVTSRNSTWACSCLCEEYGFLLKSGTELPHNAIGVPWHGSLYGKDGKLTLPPKESFQVLTIDNDHTTDVAFDLQLIQDSPWEGLVLVVPGIGFVPGSTYRFTYQERRCRLRPEGSEVEVSVSDDPFVVNDVEATLEIHKQTHGTLQVVTISGMCTTFIAAAQIHIEMQLPQGLSRWKDALLFSTHINNDKLSQPKVWRPAPDLCDQPPAGLSWVGKGRELVFAECGPAPSLVTNPSGQRGGAAISMPEGKHAVEMVAWLPGTNLTLTASVSIKLECPRESETTKADERLEAANCAEIQKKVKQLFSSKPPAVTKYTELIKHFGSPSGEEQLRPNLNVVYYESSQCSMNFWVNTEEDRITKRLFIPSSPWLKPDGAQIHGQR